ncbi:hypothetical protein QAD02_019688 [Eretmocerus hayati]|uniref:Uncharacterized protein n=1 Tax=Eretmocerus hayati TaxID=131215 RepID=A0ACC2PLH3_9HYME|nr:hypothetical protein QAD02_019688 [Eretmocerus hayati]
MAVRAVLAKPPSKQVEVLLSESSNVNSGNEVIPVAEITMPQTILQQKSKKLPEERITQGDDGNTEYANVCGFFVHVKSLLRNNEIRRQLKPFIEEEIVDATEFKPSLPNNFQPLRRLKNGSINQPRIQQNLFAVNTFGDNKAINGKPEKRVKLKSILRKSHTILGHDLDFSTGDDSDVTEASKSTSLVNDDDIIIDKIYVNHKPKRLKRSSKLLVTPLVRDDPINSRQKEVITKFVDESFGARNELQSPNEVEKENKDGTSLTISASADPKKNCCIPAQPDMLHLNGQTPNTDTSTRNDEVILVDDECTQSDQSPKGEGKKCKLVGNEITIFRKKKHRKKPMKKSTITNITESANPGMIPGIQKEISKRDDRMEVDHHENVLVVEDHAIDDSSARTEIPSCSSASCTGTDEGASDTFRKGLNIIIKEETILPDDYGNTADFEITGINHDFAMLEHLRDAEDENNDRIELIPVFKEEEPWYDDHFDSGGEESSFDHHPPNPNFDHNGRNDALKPKRRIVRRGYRRRRKNVIINRRRKNVVTNQRHDPSFGFSVYMRQMPNSENSYLITDQLSHKILDSGPYDLQ